LLNIGASQSLPPGLLALAVFCLRGENMDKTLLLMVVDVVVSLATYFITKYLAPEIGNDILYLIGGLQPLVIYVIKAEKDREVAALSAGLHPKTMQRFK
jgi:hypothetical protein